MGRRGGITVGSHRLADEVVGQYVLAGRAVVTMKNKVSGSSIMFSVERKSVDAVRPENVWFVKVVDTEYRYLGLYNGLKLVRTKASEYAEDSVEFQAFSILVDRYINAFHPHPALEVYHNGCCGKCGRTLTNPESLTTGMGPICSGLK